MKKLTNVVVLYLYLIIVWTIYRCLFQLPSWLDELIIKPLLWIGPVLLLVKIEKQKLISIGWSLKKLFHNLYLGWGLGAFFALEGLLANAIKYRGLVFVPLGLSPYQLINFILISLVTAFSEETLFRGYIQTRLEKILDNDLAANIIASIAFSLIHLPIAIFVLGYNLPTLASYLFIMLILGFADGFIFQKTKTIVAPTISHALWNLSILLFR